ncbi:tandem-type lipoprotein [Staphylococcus agnetis]|uniref:Tandem-type lipoprotein n=1 Tax=Staphylococcus agnetis TaxID=985762 RepID=A0ABD7TVP3_9STAP|nr:tandem-type lipoprotein [Staphylococcus agnetis]UXU58318.1 tandem-type lipoprotein [Staphylococcus agnetis]
MKKISLNIILITIVIISSSCGLINNENSEENINETSSEKKIKQSFNKSLEMYPIKNLEDFYDKEGFRDGEFDKDDKGTWYLNSKMSIQTSEDDNLLTKGMLLRINRNTRTSEGEYIIRTTGSNKSEKKYPVKMVGNRIIPTKPIKNPKVEEEIKNFKFFIQYANFKDLDNYGLGNFDYNPNVPSYSAEYQLTNDDYNVKQLRNRFDIPTNKAPKLFLKGVGDFKGSSVGYQLLEIQFEENKNSDIYFNDYVNLQPSKQ